MISHSLKSRNFSLFHNKGKVFLKKLPEQKFVKKFLLLPKGEKSKKQFYIFICKKFCLRLIANKYHSPSICGANL